MVQTLSPGTFYGERLKSRTVGGFILTECLYAPELQIPTHTHEQPFFYLVLQGNSTEVYGNKAREAIRSTLAFHPTGEPHSNRWHETGGRCFTIELTPPVVRRLSEHSMQLDHPVEFRDCLQTWLAVRLHREFHQADNVAPLAMEGLALELLAEAARFPAKGLERKPPRWLRQARDLIHEHFAAPLPLDQVAELTGVHPTHLARAFRQHYRCTIGGYIRQTRVEYACRQLSNSEESLLEIALTAGFTDQSHLTRIFKGLTGMTPAEYRKIFRRG